MNSYQDEGNNTISKLLFLIKLIISENLSSKDIFIIFVTLHLLIKDLIH